LPRRCSVCDHIERKSIDAAIAANNDSIRSIAKKNGLTSAAVLRHRDSHLGPRLARAQTAREEQGAESILDRLGALAQTTQELLSQAIDEKDRGTAAKLVRESRENLLAIARLTGQLRDGHGNLNVAIDARTLALIGDLDAADWKSLAAELSTRALPGTKLVEQSVP